MEKALSRSGQRSKELISTKTMGRGLEILNVSFPNLNLTEKKIEIWSELLCDLTDKEFICGIKRFCLSHKEIYPNTNIIAHIRTYALEDANQKTSGEAWSEVLQAVAHVGSYGSPEFEDEDTTKAVECVGWKNICMSERIGVERAHFMKSFDEIVNRRTRNKITGE